MRFLICLCLLLLTNLSFAFQLNHFFPERKAEVLELGDSVLLLKERQRPEFINVSGYPKMPLNRLLSEYHLHKAGDLIQKALYDSARLQSQLGLAYVDLIADDELKLVSMVTAARIERLSSNYSKSQELLEETEGLKASRPQQAYRLEWLKIEARWQKDDVRELSILYEILDLAKEENTDAMAWWVVYAKKELGTVYHRNGKLDSARVWFRDANQIAAAFSDQYLAEKMALARAYSSFLLKIGDYQEALDALIDMDKPMHKLNNPLDLSIYFRRWMKLYTDAPAEFIKSNKDRLLYSPEDIVQYYGQDRPELGLLNQFRELLQAVNYYEKIQNWSKAAETYRSLRTLENTELTDQLQAGYAKSKELSDAVVAAREELIKERLRTSKNNQLIIAMGFVFMLGLSIYVYRTSKQRKVQNLALREKNRLIENQKEDIEQINQLKSKFFTNISHELRTPLTLAQGNLNNTLSGKYGKLNDRQAKSLAIAGANSNRILGLVQDMLDLSKIESGKEKLNARKVDLENEVHAVLNLFDVQLEEKELEVDVKVVSSVEGVYMDPLKLETILFNLISNAVKHGHRGSNLTIEVWEEGNQQKLSVCNQGKGIAASELPYVFDRFFQAGSAKSGEGSGVGLSLTKELVDLHKGEITVSSTLGESTCFTVSILKGKSHFADDELVDVTAPDQEPVLISEGLKVLVVEDNADMRHYLYELLSARFKVSLAENGQDALNRIETIQPDLVITDYMMPEMNGVKFFRSLSKLEGYTDIPVVFLTARAIERDREALLNEGVADYILKPFDDADLYRRIGHLLSLKGERKKHRAGTSAPVDEMENRFLNQLRAKVFSSLQDTQLNPAVLAEVLSVSERTLYRKVKVATGFSPQAYIKEIRLQEARRLIQDEVYESVSDVAYAVGFEHLSHFSTSYKERFGVAASAQPKT